MTEDRLLLLVTAVVAVYVFRMVSRLAPPFSELPLKTLTAALLSALVALADTLPYTVGDALRIFALIAAPVYAAAPLVIVGTARLRAYRLAGLLTSLLYWTGDGRAALRRLITQVALQRGDVEAALRFLPGDDPLMTIQAHGLREEWERVLEIDLPAGADNTFLGDAVRIEALLALGRQGEAEAELGRMRRRWEEGEQGTIGYRSIRLSEARIAAEQGDLGRVRELLAQPLPGVPAHRLLAILARGAESAERFEDAARLYGQAYGLAPEGLRGRYASRVAELGFDLPTAVPRQVRPAGTIVLSASLVVLYLLQTWFDATASVGRLLGSALAPSSIASAFLLGFPPLLPAHDAWWRFLSYAFVHGGLLHIGFNAWVLFDIGRMYEARRGAENLLAAFAIGTAMGAYITTIAHTGGPLVLVGASGGVLGVAGALLADTLVSRRRGDRMLTGSLLRWLALIAAISIFIPAVSLWGHVGGVIGGLLWGFVRQGLPRSRAVDAAAGALAATALLVALAQVVRVALALL